MYTLVKIHSACCVSFSYTYCLFDVVDKMTALQHGKNDTVGSFFGNQSNHNFTTDKGGVVSLVQLHAVII